MHAWRIAWGVVGVLLALSDGAVAAAAEMGRRIDIGGYALRIDCRGRSNPTVVLDAGLGDAGNVWTQVQDGLAATARVCAYDRAGYGDSDLGPQPRASARLAAELRTLLARAGIPPPYVLVGHSFGGYTMRLFAGLYPRDVAGLVLVDAPHEDQIGGFLRYALPGATNAQEILRRFWRPEWVADLKLEELQPLARWLGKEPKTLYAIMSELAAYPTSEQEARAAVMPDTVPLIVLMHGERIFPPGLIGDRLEQDWLELQRQLASRSRNGALIIVPNAGHNLHFSQPEVVVSAVRRLLDNLSPVKNGAGLSYKRP